LKIAAKFQREKLSAAMLNPILGKEGKPHTGSGLLYKLAEV